MFCACAGDIKMNFYRTKSEVFVFHDETGKAGNEGLKGHVLLFVPVKIWIRQDRALFSEMSTTLCPLQELFSKISELRRDYSTDRKFHFKEISGKNWTKYDEAEKQLILIGVDALRSKRAEMFKSPLMCKMAIMFFFPPNPENLISYGGPQKN